MSSQNRLTEWGSAIPPHCLAGLPPQTPVLLALSGGADSVALLHLLLSWQTEYGFPLSAAHVHHGIRGEEADRDAAFCRSLCREHGVELHLLECDIPSMARDAGKGVEETAREVRYRYFAELMREHGIPLLVTAHHADDHLETLLFRLSRGTGLSGLCGIAPTRPFAEGQLVRPLLHLSRRQIRSLCRENGWSYVTDSTNENPDYARNRLRSRVVPVLEELFGAPSRRAVELSAKLREDEDYLTSQAADALHAARVEEGLSCAKVSSLPPAIMRRVLQSWVREQTGEELESVHLEALRAALQSEGKHHEVALPGNRLALCDRGRLILAPRSEAISEWNAPLSQGVLRIPETGMEISVQKMSEKIKINNLSTGLYIILPADFVIMKNDLFWRGRLPGDRLWVHGVHRKVGKLLGEVAVAPYLRERLPLLCDAKGPVWVPLVGTRDGIVRPSNSCEGYLIQIFLPTSGQ